MYWTVQQEAYSILVMELLGPSLADLFNFCNRRFSLKTTLLLPDQLLLRIEFVHSCGVVHRDLKPDNFLMGLGKRANQVYVTDMGLAWDYEWQELSDNNAQRDRKQMLLGTADFASINGHYSRRRLDAKS